LKGKNTKKQYVDMKQYLEKCRKKMVRIMMGYRNRVSCRSLFKKLGILSLTSQFVLLLMLFVVKNKHFFILNIENHSKSTRQLNNLYHPITSLTVYQRGVHCMGIRIFNNLPPHIKAVSNNVKKFENCLKRFLYIHSFYSLEEYFHHNLFTSWNVFTSQPLLK
jgi:hypothetical protein